MSAWRNKTHRKAADDPNKVQDLMIIGNSTEHNVSCRVKFSAALNSFGGRVSLARKANGRTELPVTATNSFGRFVGFECNNTDSKKANELSIAIE